MERTEGLTEAEQAERARDEAEADQRHAGLNEPGALEKQTPGLDPDETRREAGPDWPAGTRGDLEQGGSSGQDGNQGRQSREVRPTLG
jgi:hypothetical protein